MDNELGIDRTYEDDSFLITYEKGIIKDYEKRVLAGRELGDLLEMRFISSDNHDTVYYAIPGCLSLDQVKVNDLYEAMDIIEGVLTVLIKAEDYLIDIGNICLDYRWIYWDSIGKSVNLAYIPRIEVLKWQKSIFNLVGDLQEMCSSREAQPFLENLKNYMTDCQRTLQDLLLKVCDLRRDARISIGSI